MPTGTRHSEMDARRASRGRWRYTLGCGRVRRGAGSVAADEAIRAALEAVGISFSFEIANGRARPAGVTYSPRDRNDGH